MKKYIVLLLLLLCIPVFVLKESEEKKPKAKPVLRIGAECDYVPNSWEEYKPSDSNVPIANLEGYYAEGYDIQIARIVAEELGMTLEVRKFAWNDLLPALNRGEIDAVFSSMLDTPERKLIADFSDPYEVEPTEYAMIVDSVSPYITAKSLRDFSGAKIIGERGTKLDEVIVQIPGAVHMKPMENLQGVIEAVLNGDADGAVIETDTGHYYELINKKLTMIRFPENEGFKLGFTGVCAGVKKGNTELLNKINIVLGKIPRSERRKIMDTANSRMMTNLR
ncbi:MAG: transporter substrate-binding domain-containing protein [Synergistaceae bacterium]|nr:transporter substrate-binding domain-containing protein [Synergistaceae bacterium]